MARRPPPENPFNRYLDRVGRDLRRGIATEHTYRAALEELVESLQAGVDAVNEPRRVACGAPDYTVFRNTRHGGLILGHIEAKDVGSPLAEVAESDQLTRYRRGLDNLLLTDYLAFRWFVKGELRQEARLATWSERRGFVSDADSERQTSELLQAFLSYQAAPLRSAQELAVRMAALSHLIRDIVVTDLESQTASEFIVGMRDAFRESLLPGLSDGEFADMFAQTLAYGLFAARVSHDATQGRFLRSTAGNEIPRTNPFLRRLFGAIAGVELDDEPFTPYVDDLAQLLADSDMAAILRGFLRETRRDDPVVHFYETFLTAYDPALRERRGVYYTPTPVVSYIVRSVDLLLRQAFGCHDGLAATDLAPPDPQRDDADRVHRVLFLDPACGTGTFLFSIVDAVRQSFIDQRQAGMWSGYVRDHLLTRLFGFELLMAPYAVAHLKLAMQLRGFDLPAADRNVWAYDFASQSRLQVYLTNTLEDAARRSELLLGRFLNEEADAASEVKHSLPIMVVLGNPPYSGHSANQGDSIRALVDDYKREYPDLHRPAQAKWLQDDYVKFIRFGQERIERTGAGILAFITNNRYLRNRTFRGMRDQLMRAFTDIYVLNLHGDSTRQERAPDGGPDVNVFDIQQGVAIALFVKRPNVEDRARIVYADLWGDRDSKYEWLETHDINTTQWTQADAQEPLFLFVPRDANLREEYARGWDVARIMSRNGAPAPGVVTTHDEFAISFTPEEAREKVERLCATADEAEARRIWRLCRQAQWNYDAAVQHLRSDRSWEEGIVPILYRPFDTRWTVWDSHVAVHRRQRVMQHMLAGDNIALILPRTVEIGAGFEHVFSTRTVAQHHAVSTKEVNYIFPLYLYPQAGGALELYDPTAREPNLAPEYTAALSAILQRRFATNGAPNTFSPEDVFGFIYAVLHSTSFGERYSQFMEEDFPRIPMPPSAEVFFALAEKGRELANLHSGLAVAAMHRPFPVPGTNEVARQYPKYDVETQRVYINRDQYFPDVAELVWEFRIGGGYPARKWLSDRRGRLLTYDDLSEYAQVLGAIDQTVAIVDEIETLIEEYGGWPLQDVPVPLPAEQVPGAARVAERRPA